MMIGEKGKDKSGKDKGDKMTTMDVIETKLQLAIGAPTTLTPTILTNISSPSSSTSSSSLQSPAVDVGAGPSVGMSNDASTSVASIPMVSPPSANESKTPLPNDMTSPSSSSLSSIGNGSGYVRDVVVKEKNEERDNGERVGVTTATNGRYPPLNIEEYDDYIVINGQRMDKPLVEKPIDADDHNIIIYYGIAPLHTPLYSDFVDTTDTDTHTHTHTHTTTHTDTHNHLSSNNKCMCTINR
jgi:hypothetical protein